MPTVWRLGVLILQKQHITSLMRVQCEFKEFNVFTLYMITSTDINQLRRGCASNCHSENVYEMFCVDSALLLATVVRLGA